MAELDPRRTIPLPRTAGETLRDFEVRLMGAFELSQRESVVPLVLPGSSQRLIAFLALQGRSMTRDAAAGALWPEVSEAQAHASLRSAIWRLDDVTRKAMQVDVLDIALRDVTLDVRDSTALAHRLLIVDTTPSDVDMTAAAISALSSELLPDWYDDWVIIEAEDWRQLRLHALESVTGKLAAVGRFGEAISAARAAMRGDPLRESAHAALIQVHLAEGNQSEALAAFVAYQKLLHDELGLEPTAELRALIRDLHR